jgi:hypothetical protein
MAETPQVEYNYKNESSKKRRLKMKKTKIAILLLLFFTATFSLYSGFSYQLDVVSRYIWRGFDLNPPKKPAVQPQVTYAFGDSGFAVNLFLNFSFEDHNTNEVDFTFTYDFKTGEDLALTLGFTNYCWPFAQGFKLNKFNDYATQEFFVSAGFPKVFLAPTVSVYYDINLGDGLYAELGIGHGLEINKDISLDLSASLGYNAGQWLPNGADTGFSDLNIGAALPLKSGKFTITPYAAYTFVLLDSVGPDDYFWAGISITR